MHHNEWRTEVLLIAFTAFSFFNAFASKVTLRPIVPQTHKEKVEYSIAAERRRVRMVHDDIIKDLLSSGSIQQGDARSHLRLRHPR